MSLPFVVQQGIRLFSSSSNSSSPASITDPSSATSEQVLNAPSFGDGDGHRASQSDGGGLPPLVSSSVESKDEDDDDEAKKQRLWSRLREYEAEEAQSLHQRLSVNCTTEDSGGTEKYSTEGHLLFTDEYIRRYLEEEERRKRQPMDWTRSNIPTSSANTTTTSSWASEAAEKEGDLLPERCTAAVQSHTHHHHHSNDPAHGIDDQEAEICPECEAEQAASTIRTSNDDMFYFDPSGDGTVRSTLSSVSSALRRKMRFPKVMSIASKKRIHQQQLEQQQRAGGESGVKRLASSALGYAVRGIATDQHLIEPYNPSASGGHLHHQSSEFEARWDQEYSPFSLDAYQQDEMPPLLEDLDP